MKETEEQYRRRQIAAIKEASRRLHAEMPKGGFSSTKRGKKTFKRHAKHKGQALDQG